MNDHTPAPLFDRARVLDRMEAAGLDGLLVTSWPLFIYLTGVYQQIEATFIPQQHLAAVAARAGDDLKVIPVVPWVDLPFVQDHSWTSRAFGWVQFGAQGGIGGRVAGLPADQLTDDIPSAIVLAIKELGLDAARIGVEGDRTAGFLPSIRAGVPNATFSDAGSVLDDVRMVKTDEEVRRLKHSASVVDTMYDELLKVMGEGVTEWDLAQTARRTLLSDRAERIMFFDVGIGSNSMIPHGEPTDRAFRPGDMIRYDAGVAYQGYASDFGRSWVLGTANDEQKRGHETCLRTFEQLADTLGPGVPGSEIYRVHAEGLGQYFSDFPLVFVGHGVGLEIHEAPYFSADATTQLEPNMVVNVEPGAWIPKKEGMFLEGSFLITETGCEQISRLDHTDLTL